MPQEIVVGQHADLLLPNHAPMPVYYAIDEDGLIVGMFHTQAAAAWVLECRTLVRASRKFRGKK